MARDALRLETKSEMKRLVQMFRGVNRSVAGGIVSSAFSSKKPVSLRDLMELMRWTLRPRKVMPKFLARIVGMFQQYCDAMSSEEMMKYASDGRTDPPKFVGLNVREVWRSLYRLSRSKIDVDIVAEHVSISLDVMACARVARDLSLESIRHMLQSERTNRTRKDRRKMKVMKERVQMLQLNYRDGSRSVATSESSNNSSEYDVLGEEEEMVEEEKSDLATSTRTLELRSRAKQIRNTFPLIARAIDFVKKHCIRRLNLGLGISTRIVESRGKCVCVCICFSLRTHPQPTKSFVTPIHTPHTRTHTHSHKRTAISNQNSHQKSRVGTSDEHKHTSVSNGCNHTHVKENAELSTYTHKRWNQYHVTSTTSL